jgi:predicted peroxiredoxin
MGIITNTNGVKIISCRSQAVMGSINSTNSVEGNQLYIASCNVLYHNHSDETNKF